MIVERPASPRPLKQRSRLIAQLDTSDNEILSKTSGDTVDYSSGDDSESNTPYMAPWQLRQSGNSNRLELVSASEETDPNFKMLAQLADHRTPHSGENSNRIQDHTSLIDSMMQPRDYKSNSRKDASPIESEETDPNFKMLAQLHDSADDVSASTTDSISDPLYSSDQLYNHSNFSNGTVNPLPETEGSLSPSLLRSHDALHTSLTPDTYPPLAASNLEYRSPRSIQRQDDEMSDDSAWEQRSQSSTASGNSRVNITTGMEFE